MSNTILCRYYARGMCRFGESCRFVHAIPNDALNINDSVEYISATGNTSNNNASITQNLDIELNERNNWAMAPIFVPKYQRNVATSSNRSNTTNLSITINNTDFERRVDILPSTSTNDNSNDLKSYAEVVMGPGGAIQPQQSESKPNILCPYEMNCVYGDLCQYQHNMLCEMCGRFSLHPTDREQRKKHIAACIQQHEKDMELSFAVARSKDKTCGICFDIIMEKSGREQRFGILPNCNHIFCLECIRKWRQAKQFDNKIIRACPECRIPSDYVCPSAFWVETKEEKDKLLTDYKNALGEKDCKYFKKGEGKCPFGNKCFYKHALPNGRRVDVGIPRRTTRKLQRAEDEILDLFDVYLWDFVDRREYHWLEILSNLSNNSDSEWSEEYD